MVNQINIELYTPYKKQLEIHNTLYHNDIFGVVVVCGRQVGKTLLGINQALKWALDQRNQNIMFVLPTDSQANKVYKQMVDAIISTNIIKSYKGQSGSAEIIFVNNSKILFRSALQENSLRGYTNDYLIIDEAAFIDEHIVNTILLPTLTVKGKKILILSTPKGKNWLFKFFNKSLTDNKWASFKFTSYDSPYVNKTFLDEQKKSLPTEIFEQEYMGEFIDKASLFKNLDDIFILDIIPKTSERPFIGVDLGMSGDYTVATVINQNYEVIDILRFTNVNASELKSRLINFFDKHNPQNIIIENNGLGAPIVSDLIETKWGDFISSFTTTPKSKHDIIQNLIRLFNNKQIKLPLDNQLRLELENFIFIFTASGNIKYQASSGIHDDMVMSLAFAVEALNRGNKKQFDTFFTSI